MLNDFMGEESFKEGLQVSDLWQSMYLLFYEKSKKLNDSTDDLLVPDPLHRVCGRVIRTVLREVT